MLLGTQQPIWGLVNLGTALHSIPLRLFLSVQYLCSSKQLLYVLCQRRFSLSVIFGALALLTAAMQIVREFNEKLPFSKLQEVILMTHSKHMNSFKIYSTRININFGDINLFDSWIS
jgi:hypothetical protein